MMSKAVFNPEIKKVLDHLLASIPGVAPGKMFGYPAYYRDGKMFACLYENGVGIRVPEQTAESLAGREGLSYFQPLGRARMRSWLFVSRATPEDFLQDLPLFITAIEYVSPLAGKEKDKRH